MSAAETPVELGCGRGGPNQALPLAAVLVLSGPARSFRLPPSGPNVNQSDRPGASGAQDVDGKEDNHRESGAMSRRWFLISLVVARAGEAAILVGSVLLMVSLPAGGGTVFTLSLFEIGLVSLLIGFALILIAPTVWWLSAMMPAKRRRRANTGDTRVAGISERTRALDQRGSEGSEAREAVADRDRGHTGMERRRQW
jgi:hypothetical protein